MLLVAETDYRKENMTSILSYDGLPISYRCIFDSILKANEREAAA